MDDDLEAGRLTHRVTLKMPDPAATTTNAFGEPVPGFRTLALRWASVEPLSGRELWAAQQVQADVTHKVTLRYLAGVTPACQVVYAGRTFNVESIQNPGEQNRSLVLVCKEQLAG